jgi:hypothetical protein
MARRSRIRGARATGERLRGWGLVVLAMPSCQVSRGVCSFQFGRTSAPIKGQGRRRTSLWQSVPRLSKDHRLLTSGKAGETPAGAPAVSPSAAGVLRWPHQPRSIPALRQQSLLHPRIELVFLDRELDRFRFVRGIIHNADELCWRSRQMIDRLGMAFLTRRSSLGHRGALSISRIPL